MKMLNTCTIIVNISMLFNAYSGYSMGEVIEILKVIVEYTFHRHYARHFVHKPHRIIAEI